MLRRLLPALACGVLGATTWFGHQAPIVGMSYEDCGPYSSAVFGSDGKVELHSLLGTTEVYPYRVLDGDQVAIEMPFAEVTAPFDGDAVLTLGGPKFRGWNGSLTCEPSGDPERGWLGVDWLVLPRMALGLT